MRIFLYPLHKVYSMPIQLVVFDLAGTTVKDNQDVHRVLQKALAHDHVIISLEDANEVMGIPKPVAIRSLLKKRYNGDREINESWINSIHERFVAEMILFYQTDAGVGEKVGVTQTFLELKKRNIKVVVDTGFDRPITDSILNRLGWSVHGLIDGSVSSDEVERGRPYPDMIFKAMEITGVISVKFVAKVGDTVSDLLEGNSAGCALVIGVTSGSFTREELSKEKSTHLVENIHEILPILDHIQ